MVTATLATALTMIAIVTQDHTTLRGAPRDTAPQQAVLWQGDSLEIRGTRGDFLQVYDHRHERAGYIRATQVRVQSLNPENAPELLAIVHFLRDTPGSESLGISYAAAYLKAAPAQAINGDVFDALGVMADRLARRASLKRPAAGKEGDAVGAHLEVAATYGVSMVSFERDGEIRLCYNGDAQRRVLALPSTDIQRAVAVLILTRHDCVSPSLTPVERFAVDNWRADVLDRVETRDLPAILKNRLHMRKAGVWASLAYQRARRSDLGEQAAQVAADRAINELALVNKNELMETDSAAYNDAAIRVGASRWAAQPAPSATAKPLLRVAIAVSPGQSGETCVHLVDAKHDLKHPLLTRCTYSIVWPASAVSNNDGTALTLAVQPMDTWLEMWAFRKQGDEWKIDVLPPAVDNPNLGYMEFAGWVPGNDKMLVAREALVDGRFKRSFEVLRLSNLNVDKQADKADNLSLFSRWQSPAWKAQTVILR
ncbi:MAG: hypothetical protein EPO06_08220 [Burkholderiaceae bacterium]|nr:MAG: hypothetical protein EPO06_08220 [Burkholderiaceae bacterium]